MAASAQSDTVLWSVKDAEEITTVGAGVKVTALAFVVQNNLVIGYSNGTVREVRTQVGSDMSSANMGDGSPIVGISSVMSGCLIIVANNKGAFCVYNTDNLDPVTTFDVEEVMTKGVAKISCSTQGDNLVLLFGSVSGCVGSCSVALPGEADSEFGFESERRDTVGFDLDTSFFFASKGALAILSGNLSDEVKRARRLVRVFVSSAVSDTVEERACILSTICSEVRQYARSRGLDFRLVCDSWTAPGQDSNVITEEVRHML